jgi:O-antigen/teichoic acid export membrane protein
VTAPGGPGAGSSDGAGDSNGAGSNGTGGGVPGNGEIGGGEDGEELNARLAGGLKWSFVSTILGRVLTPVTAIILAHLLVPEDFGVFAVAVAVQAALMSFNDLGVSNAIIWWPGDVRKAARTATTLALGTSTLLYLGCFIAAPLISDFMRVPEATGVLRLLALSVIVDGISSVPVGLLGREFRQGRRAAADWAGFVVATGITIWLALAGYGAWSLAWGRIAGNVVTTTTLFVLSGQAPHFGFDRVIARKLIGYGLPLAGSSLLVFAMLNVDYIIVGRILGATALGLYTIAFNLSSWPSNVISVTIRRVSIPLFARLGTDRRQLSGTFLAGMNNLTLVTALLVAGLFALAVPIIHLLYPSDYWGAAAPLALLSVLGMARVIIDFFYDLFAGIGKSRMLMALQGLWLVTLIPALVVGAELGDITGVAIGQVVVAWGLMVPAYVLFARPVGIPALGVVRAASRPVVSGCLSALAGVGVVFALGTGIAGLLAGGVAVVLVFLVTAARPRDLLSLPKRFLRFEAPDRAPITIPEPSTLSV